MNHGILHNPSKNVICFYIDQFLKCMKIQYRGSFVEEDQCLMYFHWELAKKQLKSSKMRRVKGANDLNDTFFIRFGYRTVEKKSVFSIYLKQICIPSANNHGTQIFIWLLPIPDRADTLFLSVLALYSISHQCIPIFGLQVPIIIVISGLFLWGWQNWGGLWVSEEHSMLSCSVLSL